MLIEIERVYKSSGLVKMILLNTDYIIKIEDTEDEKDWETKPRTRVVIDSCTRDGPDIIYTNYTTSYIKGLITKTKNRTKKKA